MLFSHRLVTPFSALAASAFILTTIGAQGSYAAFGRGCPGTNNKIPQLSATGNHAIGGTTTVRTTNQRPLSAGVLYFGISKTNWGALKLPLALAPFGMGTCTQYCSGDIIFPMSTDPRGNAAFTFKHPNNTAFVNLRFYNQGVLLDPGSKTSLKLILSNAGEMRIGNGDGPTTRASSGFQVTIPRISALNFPGMSVRAAYSGNKWLDACNRFTPLRRCAFDGTGKVTGAIGGFDLPTGRILSTMAGKICEPVRRLSLGTLTCLAGLDMRVNGVSLDGNIRVSKNDCSGASSYSGNGSLTFPGGLTTSARTRLIIDPPFLPKIDFTAGLNASATPTGTWQISNNRLSMSIRIPSVRISGGFTIPVFNRRINLNFSIPTPFFSVTSPSVPLPAVNIRC